MKGTHKILKKLIAKAKAEQLIKAQVGASRWWPATSVPQISTGAGKTDRLVEVLNTREEDYAIIRAKRHVESDRIKPMVAIDDSHMELQNIFSALRGKF